RQVHRVLKPNAPLVFSLPHPAYDMIDDDADEPLLVRRSYFDHSPIDYQWNGISFTDYHHTIADIFMGLHRASYRVDVIMEPEPSASGPRSQFWREAFRYVPRTLVVQVGPGARVDAEDEAVVAEPGDQPSVGATRAVGHDNQVDVG